MKIKILKSDHPLVWYSTRVGEIFDVEGVYKTFNQWDTSGVWVREGGTYNARNVVYNGDYTVIEE